MATSEPRSLSAAPLESRCAPPYRRPPNYRHRCGAVMILILTTAIAYAIALVYVAVTL